MFNLFKKKKVVKKCLGCDVKVGDKAPQMKYRYYENGESIIATAFLCNTCADRLKPMEESDYE
jgi:hypothetical protein